MQAIIREFDCSSSSVLEADTRAHANWKICLALVAFALLAFAPAAQAAYAQFGTTVGQNVDIDIEGKSVTIMTEARNFAVDASAYGVVKMNFSLVFSTIQFNGEPAMLQSVDLAGPNARAIITGPTGTSIVSAGMPINQLASSVSVVSLPSVQVANGVNFDGIGVVASPIPEPSAALLFAAGLSAVGVSIRRKRE